MSLHHVLQRYSDSGESTLGLLFLKADGRLLLQSYVLEDESRPTKVAGDTRIHAGFYDLALRRELTPLTKKYRDRFPDWFSWHVELVGVPGFSNVYIHVGNTDDDTDACLLLGDTANNNRANTGFIGESVEAYRRWYQLVVTQMLHGVPALIEIRDESRFA